MLKRSEAVQFTDNDFKKSSFSGQYPYYCVLIANKKGIVAIRDSKDKTKTTLYFTKAEWDSFVSGVNAGEFDV